MPQNDIPNSRRSPFEHEHNLPEDIFARARRLIDAEQRQMLTDYDVSQDAWKCDPDRTDSAHALAAEIVGPAADRITALEAEVARLRGLVEQAEYQLGGENNAVRRRWADWRETARHALAQGEQP